MAVEGLSLVPFAEGVWLDMVPVTHLGVRLTAAMTVLRLADGSLLLHSPVQMTPSRREAVTALGTVAHLYAPNLFHHRWLGEWADAFPRAQVHGPAGLANKRPDLRIDRVFPDGPLPGPIAEVIEECPVSGFRLQECVLFYRPANTLIIADLFHNVGRPQHWWTKLYARTMGFYDRAALSRLIRWTAFSNKKDALHSIQKLLELPFSRVVVGHGAPVTTRAHHTLKSAFQWLLKAPANP